MNWDAIGAIAELLGALGVILTLAYLAIQIRHSSDLLEKNIQSNEVNALDALVANYNNWRQLIIESEELSDIYIRGLTDIGSLTINERLRFNFFMTSFIWISYEYWSWQGSELVSESNVHLFGHVMRHKGGREWYKGQRPYLGSELQKILDNVLKTISNSESKDLELADSSSMFAGPLEMELAKRASGS